MVSSGIPLEEDPPCRFSLGRKGVGTSPDPLGASPEGFHMKVLSGNAGIPLEDEAGSAHVVVRARDKPPCAHFR